MQEPSTSGTPPFVCDASSVGESIVDSVETEEKHAETTEHWLCDAKLTSSLEEPLRGWRGKESNNMWTWKKLNEEIIEWSEWALLILSCGFFLLLTDDIASRLRLFNWSNSTRCRFAVVVSSSRRDFSWGRFARFRRCTRGGILRSSSLRQPNWVVQQLWQNPLSVFFTSSSVHLQNHGLFV